MEKIYIPQLAKAVNATETLHFKEFLDGLETLTPVQGVMQVKHVGTFLEVKAKAWAIATLTCDRTLVQFNHRLELDTTELIFLAEPLPPDKYAKEQEIAYDDLVDTLAPNGHFDPQSWLYEQMCLTIPFQKIAPDAPAVLSLPDVEDSQPDKRWAGLLALQEPVE